MATASKIIQSVNHEEYYLSATFAPNTTRHERDCDECQEIDNNDCSVTFTVTNLRDISVGHAEEDHLLIHLEEVVDKRENDCEEKVNEKEEDEEKDLTNLTWLTELRNQPITLVTMPLDETDETKSTSQKPISQNSKYLQQTNAQLFYQVQSPTNRRILNNEEENELINHQKEAKRPTPIERFEIFLNKIKRDLEIYHQSANVYQNDVSEKPPFNYSHIIGMAMLENGRRVTLQQICSWIELKFAFFRVRKKWNNSIRHNLSLHPCFRKIGRNKEDKGKGGYWELAVDPKKCDRKRIRNRKSLLKTISKHNNNNIIGKKLPKVNDVQQLMASSRLSEDEFADKANEREQIIFDIMNVQEKIDEESSASCTANTNNGNCFLTPNCQQNHHHQQQSEIECAEDDILINDLINRSTQGTSKVKEKQYHESSQDYTFGTIIISTSQMTDLVDVAQLQPTAFNYIINHTGTIDNQESSKSHRSCLHENVSGEENVSAHNNMLISPGLAEMETANTDSGIPEIINESTSPSQLKPAQQRRKNVIVEQLVQPSSSTPCVTITPSLYTTDTPYPFPIQFSSAPTSTSSSKQYHSSAVSINDYYQNSVNDNFSHYIDGIDEAFQYLRSIDTNRNEDTLDNLLDISVGDY
uniref:Fork-head domain-containing protein n=1 Tax=Glossina brevipalpis TaxID=37001 RepID=A0A1A9WYD4_9MUSC